MLTPELLPPTATSELGPALLATAAAAGLGTGALARALGLRGGAAFAAGAAAACAVLGLPARALLVAASAWTLFGVERCVRAVSLRERVLALALAGGAALAGTAAHGAGAAVVLVIAAAAWVGMRVERGGRARGLAAFTAVAFGAAAGSFAGARPVLGAPFDVGAPDLVVLGLAVVAAAVVLRWRSLASGESRGPSAELGFAGVLCALASSAWIAAARGADGALGAAFTAELAWCSPVVIAFVLARAFDPTPNAAAPKALAPLTVAAGAFALQFGALDSAWAKLPILGTACAEDWAALATVAFSSCAAFALDSAPRATRRRAAVALVMFAALAHGLRPEPTLPRGAAPIDLDDELVGVLARPEAERAGPGLEVLEVVLWVHPALSSDAHLAVERRGERIATTELARVDETRASELARGRNVPAGAALFALEHAWDAPEHAGWWTLRAEFVRVGLDVRSGERLGERVIAHLHVPDRAAELQRAALLLGLLVLLVAARPGSRAGTLTFCALLAAGTWFALSR